MVKKFPNPITNTIVLYLLAIVLANNVVSLFGEVGLWVTGFFLIPFDLLARDILHEHWRNNCLFKRMFLLVISGGIISFATNPDTLHYSIAGVLAFASAGITNTLVYALLDKHKKFIKMNASNFFASIADTSIFISIAFGLRDDLFTLIFIQILIKFLGGMFWSTTYLYYANRIRKS
jgi:uncharacterized PurR-regulated membrane protein YhhQ (DUF165 family)